jgi:hypothetical protein
MVTISSTSSVTAGLKKSIAIERTTNAKPGASLVRPWPDPEVPVDGNGDRFRGQSGKYLLGLRITASDPGADITLATKVDQDSAMQ